MKKIFVITLLLMFGRSLIFAQNITDLMRIAVEENVELKMLNTEYLAALESAPQVDQWPDPEFGVGAFPLPVETRLGPQILRLGGTQMIPWPGFLESKKDLELAKAKPLQEKIAAFQLEISFELKKAYYQLYELSQSQNIIRRNIGILDALEQFALAKVESGKATAADVLRVKLKTQELNQEIQILQTAKAKPLATINQLLNRDLTIPIAIADTLAFAQIPLDKNALMESIQLGHPMFRMFALQQEVSRQAINVNNLDGKPSFGAGLDYIMVNKRDDVTSLSANGRDIIQLRGMIKIPLNKRKYEAKEREERLKIRALEEKKIDLLSKFSAAIEKAYTDHQIAQQQLELYQDQIEITEATINILETQYSASGNNFDELLRLERERIEYDLKILKAIVKSHLAKNRIERFIP